MKEYINEFIQEAQSMLSAMESDLLKLEQDPENKEIIDNVFRVMHTLKGTARMYGFENIENLAHEYETIYDRIRSGEQTLSGDIIDATLKGKDTMLAMLNSDSPQGIDWAFLEDEGKETLSSEKRAIPAGAIYCAVFAPDKGVFERGLDPDKIIKEIETSGECHVIVHEGKVPWEDQKKKKTCNTVWEIYLRTRMSKNDVESIFLFYDEKEYEVNVIDEKFLEKPTAGYKKFYKKYCDKKIRIKDHISASIDTLPEAGAAEPVLEEVDKTPHLYNEPRGKTERRQDENQSTINVSSEKIDELMNLVSELVTTTASLNIQTSPYKNFKLNNTVEIIGKLTKKFRDNALELRLLPVGTLLSRFTRHVRDLSKELNKKVRLIIEGQDTEIDKTILGAIEKPLLHIIRNSMDHGIETKEERIKLGKTPEGQLKIIAFYSGANVMIQVQDDGKGIDLDKIRETAIKKGYLRADQQISDQELIQFIMEPGFSTSDKVSKVSGRGVGMDVVKKELNNVSGSLDIETEKGLGTYITLKLPATLSIIDTLLLEVHDSKLLLPLLEVEYCFKESRKNIKNNDNDYLNYKDDLIPYISLRERFQLPENERDEEMVIIINKYDKKYGIIVDRIIGEQQAVIKPLGKLFASQPYFSGGSIMVDGKLALILDTNYLFNNLIVN